MKKRICHISTVHRGVEIRIIRKEVASMAEAGYDAHAVIAATPEEVAEAVRLGVTIHPLKERKSRIARMTAKMYEAWNTARKLKAEIYHFHDPELIPLGLFMKLCGHRIVMDVHEDLANQVLNKHWIPQPIRKLVGRIARGCERIGARFFANTLITPPEQHIPVRPPQRYILRPFPQPYFTWAVADDIFSLVVFILPKFIHWDR